MCSSFTEKTGATIREIFGKIDLDGYFGKIAWKEILWESYISC